MTFSDRPKIALIDADFLVYRVSFSSPDAPEQAVKNRLTEWLTDIVYIELQCDDYKAWITGKGNYRNDIAKTVPYKGNRAGMEKPPHYQELRQHLKKLGAVETDGEEADDAVAIESTKGGCWIVHVDKDLDQLPGWHYNPVKREEYFVTEFDGLKSFYTQMLTGDKTDNIKGIYGIGPVKAKKILERCKTEQEMFDAVVKAYEKNEETYERVLENGALLWLRRTPNQTWQPPSNLQDAHGKSLTQTIPPSVAPAIQKST